MFLLEVIVKGNKKNNDGGICGERRRQWVDALP
jgi:hypothetical protein